MEIDINDWFELKDLCDMEDYKLRPDYEGRGSDGECVGIVIPDVESLMELGIALSSCMTGGTADSMASCVRLDSMGRSTIAYFPGFEAPEQITADV